MYCHRCGAEVAPDTQFCPSCGAAMGPAIGAAAAVACFPRRDIQSHTGRWIGEGWRIVSADLGMFALLALVFLILSSAVPVILHGPLFVGFHLFCAKKMFGRMAELADLFTGFNFFIPSLVASLLISLLVSVGLVFCIVPGLVIAAMYQFVYLFILDKRMDFWPAMQASHAVVKNDYFGFTMFLLAMIGVDILGALCLIVGIFVAIPVTVAAVTVAYRDVVGFEQSTVDAL
jgi:uncharacterized membrane protein